MTSNITVSATKRYRRTGQFHVKWERLDINSELNIGRVFIYLTQVITGFICKALTLKVKKFSTAIFMLQSQKIIFV